jgi:chromosome segregation ATPase
MTFTAEQQQRHRETFIHDCRQKAWGAACHAHWIGAQLDKLIEDYGKLKSEDEKLDGEIKTLETAVDAHTKDNSDKRKALQERRNTLAKQTQALTVAMQEGQRGLNELHQSIEANLQLAAHAETWQWKEATVAPSQ